MTEQTDKIAQRQKTWQEMALRELKALGDVVAQASFLIAADRSVDAYFAFCEDGTDRTAAIEKALRFSAAANVKMRLHGEGRSNA